MANEITTVKELYLGFTEVMAKLNALLLLIRRYLDEATTRAAMKKLQMPTFSKNKEFNCIRMGKVLTI